MHHEGEETANVLNGPIVLPPAPEIVQERKQQRVRKRGVESKFAQKGVWKKILSWNVNGARARRKDNSFFLMIKGFDVLCLTEFRCPRRTFLRQPGVRAALEEEGFRFWAESVTVGNSGYAGVTVISKVPFLSAEEGVGDFELDKEGRFLALDFEGFYVAVSYFPNAGKRGALVTLDKRIRFDNKVREKLWALDKPFLLVGDLNVVSGDKGVEGGLACSHWQGHPGCSEIEMENFSVLKAENDLLDMQVEMKVRGFSKTCNCTGNADKKALTLDYILASADLFTGGWVRRFTREAHMAASDHLPQSIEVDSGLFGKTIEYIPIDKTCEEHEQCRGEKVQEASAILRDLNIETLSVLLEDRVADLTSGGDSDGAERWSQTLTTQGQALLKRWDPEGFGVVSCADINALFTGDKDLPEEAVWLDVTSFEEIQAMDYSHDKPKTLRVEIKLKIKGVEYEALVDSGASKSILKWSTLVAMVGECNMRFTRALAHRRRLGGL